MGMRMWRRFSSTAMRLSWLWAVVLVLGIPLTVEAEPEVVVTAGGGFGGPSEYQACVPVVGADCSGNVTKRSGLLGVGVTESVGHFRASVRFDSTLGTGDSVGATSGIIGSLGFNAGPLYAEVGLGLGVNWMSETLSRDSYLISPSIHSALGVRVTDTLAVVARLDGLAGAPLALMSLEWTVFRPHRPSGEPSVIGKNSSPNTHRGF